jgi:6-phosphogluconolactonase
MSCLVIGTYTDTGSRGLYQCPLCPSSKAVPAADLDNPSYMLYLQKNKKLYVVSESAEGKITVYDTADDRLSYRGMLAVDSAGLVHIAADSAERYLFTVSYEDARIMMIQLSSGGIPEKITCRIEHRGSSINMERQSRAHAHSVWLTPDQKELCVCDLGIDKIVVYEIDYQNGKLLKSRDRTVCFPGGTGPRHMTFSFDGSRAYVLTELTSQVFVYKWSSDAGFVFLQQVELLQKPDPSSTAAAIRISSDGRFLYTSCRGKDLVVVFAVQNDGFLKKNQSISAHGKYPRDILLSEDDSLLFVACRDTDAVSVFTRNAHTGMLRFSDCIKNIPKPIALQII